VKIDERQLLNDLRRHLDSEPFWSRALAPDAQSSRNYHLAIFREPYLDFILSGKKTIETRFAKRACPPYNRVANGDVLVLKESGGPVLGICTVSRVWFYRVTAASLADIRSKFGKAVCPVNDAFWDERKGASCATLMLLQNVTRLDNIHIDKRDRRGWVLLNHLRTAQSTLELFT